MHNNRYTLKDVLFLLYIKGISILKAIGLTLSEQSQYDDDNTSSAIRNVCIAYYFITHIGSVFFITESQPISGGWILICQRIAIISPL